jgi:hypothetical protein
LDLKNLIKIQLGADQSTNITFKGDHFILEAHPVFGGQSFRFPTQDSKTFAEVVNVTKNAIIYGELVNSSRFASMIFDKSGLCKKTPSFANDHNV